MFGKCKVCAEKDARIADLKLQVNDLRSLTLPTTRNPLPLLQIEADAVLSGRDEVMEIPGPNEEADEEIRERDRIFSGTYDLE